jgi:hypothetical protein
VGHAAGQGRGGHLNASHATQWKRFGDSCLGQALYRHRRVFQDAAETPVWSHLELSYFRHVVPANVISELVVDQQPEGVRVLRAEILLSTPSSFVMPRDWRGRRTAPNAAHR